MLTEPTAPTSIRSPRRRLPDERKAITHHFHVGEHEGYLTVGFFTDGSVGELFIKIAKEGSTVSGLMDSLATVFSVALQHGASLETLCEKLTYMRFEPSGWTGDPKIGFAHSIVDYISRWLALRFLGRDRRQGQLLEMPAAPPSDQAPSSEPRLVLHADCTTCGRLSRDENSRLIALSCALEHTRATGHVVVLNGTTDIPDGKDAASGADTSAPPSFVVEDTTKAL
jgi:ribonucleoside-diphosphate reductase alpha chain